MKNSSARSLKLNLKEIKIKSLCNLDNPIIRISSHILFWLTYLMIYSTLSRLNMPKDTFFDLTLRTAIYFLPVDMMATYLTIYVLMPKFLYRGKYMLFIFTFTLSAIPFILLTQAIGHYLYIPHFYPEYAYKKGFWEFSYFYSIVSSYAIVVLAASIKLTKRWYEVKERQTELENQNLRSELAMLKLQISPHFLFNTLNNIDSLIYSNQDKASESIIKLSDIMRYMIYESQMGEVPIQKEIDYINNLIELQSLRYTKENFIDFQIIGDPNQKQIAALLFVPFIENAIKHGDKNVHSPGISISLNIEDTVVKFNITNFVGSNQEKDLVGGIGLTNIKRRLELLYPNNYQLKIIENKQTYHVQLIINYLKNNKAKQLN